MTSKEFAKAGVKKPVAPAPLPEKNDIQMLSESKVRELINEQPLEEIVR